MNQLTPIPKRRSKPRRGPPDIPEIEWRNPEYRKFLRSDGICAACVKIGNKRWMPYVCDPAHSEHNGMSSKGRDSSCLPLCRPHHSEADGQKRLPNGQVGRAAFEAYYCLDMKAVAAYWWKRFQGCRTST